MKTKVIYIIGAGHSGSTLLDLVLGSHSRIESVGEITDRVGRILCGIKLHGRSEGLCTCGAEYAACEFWAPIFDRVRASAVHHRSFLLDPASAERDNELFIPEVLRQSGKQVYLESTKSKRRLQLLQQTDSLDLYVIHIVRDGRAVAYSNVRKGRNVLRYARRWKATNLSVLGLRKSMPERWLTVKYERFVSQPVEETNRIMEFLGECFEPDQMNFGEQVHHNLAGNRMRRSGSSDIVADTKFLDGIGPFAWAAATAIMYRSLRHHGYPLLKRGARELLPHRK